MVPNRSHEASSIRLPVGCEGAAETHQCAGGVAPVAVWRELEHRAVVGGAAELRCSEPIALNSLATRAVSQSRLSIVASRQKPITH